LYLRGEIIPPLPEVEKLPHLAEGWTFLVQLHKLNSTVGIIYIKKLSGLVTSGEISFSRGSQEL